MFPQRLDSPLAYDIAKAMVDGFNRHYRLFRTESARAKHRFETADWHGQQRALQEAFDVGRDPRIEGAAARAREQIERGVVEYGNAIKDLVAANIFPGDMLWKNFGITRHGKVVFYDYDEIEYITDCNFRRVPEPRNEEDEMSGEVWYSVGPKDVFPETFAPFLLGNPVVCEVFMKHHADLLDVAFWQSHKERIQVGYVYDVFPYERSRRFSQQRASI